MFPSDSYIPIQLLPKDTWEWTLDQVYESQRSDIAIPVSVKSQRHPIAKLETVIIPQMRSHRVTLPGFLLSSLASAAIVGLYMVVPLTILLTTTQLSAQVEALLPGLMPGYVCDGVASIIIVILVELIIFSILLRTSRH